MENWIPVPLLGTVAVTEPVMVVSTRGSNMTDGRVALYEMPALFCWTEALP